MKTQRIYESDASVRRFSARVRSCTAHGQDFAVVLDRTAFFPGGGGQPCDLGTLGGARVLEVFEQDGEVVHVTQAPLNGEVAGELDWARRLDCMEQHSGEHILSGTLHKLYGAENVGFHIGDPYVRVYVDLPLTAAQLAEAERAANEAVRADTPITARFPAPEELAGLTYRSKKELQGPVRIVSTAADTCACCGTHLARTGQVGLIKIFSAQNYKGGVRLAVACGGRALRLLQTAWADAEEAGRQLSSALGRLADAVSHLKQAQSGDKMRLSALQNSLAAACAAAVQPGMPAVRTVEGADGDGLRKIALACAGAAGAPCLCISSTHGGTAYALAAAPGGDVRPLCQALNEAFAGRGGGKAPFCQGNFAALPDEARLQALLRTFG